MIIAGWAGGAAEVYIHTAGGHNERHYSCRWTHSRVDRRLIIDYNCANTSLPAVPEQEKKPCLVRCT